MYWVFWLSWKILVGCAYLIYYFVVFAGLTAVAAWKILVGACRLLAAVGSKQEPQEVQQTPQEAPKPVRGTTVIVVGRPPRIEDAKPFEPRDEVPATMPEDDPRYSRPSE